MNEVVKHGSRFFLFLLIQVFVLNQLEIGFGIQVMIYPLFILLLPIETNIFVLLLLAFGLGLGIDAMSNTYGLHTSALLAVSYFRPVIFKLFAPRDDYDPLINTDMFSMGTFWFIKTFGLLLLIHHLWFFVLEMFKLNEILFVLQKTGLSVVISFLFCVLMQFLIIKRVKEK
jgi:hypothetical protein